MANTALTPFFGTLYQGADVVSHELTGFINSVTRNTSAERAALNQSVIVPVSTPKKAKDVKPGMVVTESEDFDYEDVAITITKAREIPFPITGEDYKAVENGYGIAPIMQGNFEQAIRSLVNEIELDCGIEAAQKAGLAVGSAGTTPFADNSTIDFRKVRKALNDNGAPSQRSLIINSDAGMNVLGIDTLVKVNESGDTMTLRQGELGGAFGLSIKESAGIADFIASKGTTIILDTANVKGATKLLVKTGSAGSLKIGDIFRIAGDTTQYVVQKPVSLSAGNMIEIARPGLAKASAASAEGTLVGNSARNIAFSKNAIQLVTRAPALPGGKDAAVDSYMLTDPHSGLTFEVRVYAGERMITMKVSLAWGVSAIKPEHIVTLLG